MRAAARADRALGTGLSPLRVVAAALVVDQRVLAARRATGPRGWEFPGGKVEPGETDAGALERECREELGITVRATRPLGAATDDLIELVLWQVKLLAGTPTVGRDHDELRWLDGAELDAIDWLPLDRELLPQVRPTLVAHAT